MDYLRVSTAPSWSNGNELTCQSGQIGRGVGNCSTARNRYDIFLKGRVMPSSAITWKLVQQTRYTLRRNTVKGVNSICLTISI